MKKIIVAIMLIAGSVLADEPDLPFHNITNVSHVFPEPTNSMINAIIHMEFLRKAFASMNKYEATNTVYYMPTNNIETVKALRLALEHLKPSHSPAFHHTIYMTPAAQLRAEAERIERRDADIRFIRKVLRKWERHMEALRNRP